MSDPDHDPRGSYGAPRQQPGPYGAPQYGAPRYGGPQYGPPPGYPGAAPHPRRTPPDPSKPISPSTSAGAFRSAGIAVGLLAVVLLASALFRFLGNLSYQGATESDSTGFVPLQGFFDSWLFSPFPFYVGAFAAMAFLTPIVRRSALPVVLLRAVLAGAGGMIVLMVVGVFTGVTKAVQQNDPTWVLTDIVSNPIAQGISDTAILVAAAVATWLWLGRPGATRRPFATPGMPGTVPPADAVPPATVPQNRPQPYGTPVWGQPDRSGGTQQPAPHGQPGAWRAQQPGSVPGQQSGPWPAQQPAPHGQPGAWPAPQPGSIPGQQSGPWPAQQPGGTPGQQPGAWPAPQAPGRPSAGGDESAGR